MTPEANPKSRTARTIRAAGHKAAGGHSLLTPRPVGHRLHREPNDFSDHRKGHRSMAYVPYPKWLHFEGAPSVLVQNEAEHEAVMDAREAAPEPEKRGPGRPKKVVVEPPEKVFDLAPGDDPDPPEAAAETDPLAEATASIGVEP